MDLTTIMGLLIIEQTRDLDDQEATERLAFNMRYHYALNITEDLDASKYICLNSNTALIDVALYERNQLTQ